MFRLVVLVLLLLFVPPVYAHSGRTDSDGCHVVTKKWVSKDKKRVYEKGTRHCHKVSDKVILGVDQVIVEEEPTRPKEKKREPSVIR